MLSAREAVLSIAGAWRLAKLDAQGRYFFSATVDSFWNSYWVAALVFPLHLLDMVLQFNEHGAELDPIRFYSVEVIAYAMVWFAFPLAMFFITGWIGKQHRFLRFVIASNWTALIVSVVLIPVQLSVSLGLVEGGVLSFMLAAALVYAFTVGWFVARYTLNLGGLAAVGVVILDWFMYFIIQGFAGTLM
ncbi:hypothetical protein V5T82_01635 [Magnetovibrio sp. PR-2]|uniref:hypothetical protein n=1 Tax=Magnetovibrio sp. PR-2 TaxID=3120356 RepID=UPI002FCE1055